MPITLKYGAPGAILQAGFAAGVGSRKQKEQKDLLDVWQQQTNQDFQAQQANLARQQQAGLQQQAQNFAGQQNKFNLDFRAAQNQQDRFFQAGQAELGRDFQAGQADKLMEARNRADERRFAEETFFRLPPIPEHVDPTVRKDLAGKRNAMGALLGKGWDRSDPATQKAWGEAYDAYTTGVAAIPPPDRAAETNKNTIYRDQSGKAFNEPGAGRTAFDSQTGRAIENPQAEALAQQQSAQQKQQQQQMEKFQTDQQKWLEKRHATALRIQKDNTSPDATTKPPLDFAAAEKELSAAGFDKPQPPQQAQAALPKDDLDAILEEDIQQRKQAQSEVFTSAPLQQGLGQGIQQPLAPAPQQAEIAPGFPAQPQFRAGFGNTPAPGSFAPQNGPQQGGIQQGLPQGNPATAAQAQPSLLRTAAEAAYKVGGWPGQAPQQQAATTQQPNWSGFGGGQPTAGGGGASGSWGSPEQNAAAGPQGQEEFDAQWAKLTPGQSLRAPDGTIYIKKRGQ